jgi:hypothetical protein
MENMKREMNDGREKMSSGGQEVKNSSQGDEVEVTLELGSSKNKSY